MQTLELKSLVEAGHYKPDPSRVATAMLRRRGVRELLTGVTPPLSGTDRSLPGSESRPQAA